MKYTNSVEYSLGKKFFHLSRLIKKRLDRELAGQDLYHGQARVLLMLAHHDDMMLSEIAHRMFASPAAATKAIQRLEKNGFVIRRPDEKDERVSRVHLLRKGWEAINQVEKISDELFNQFFSGFTQEELSQYDSFIDRIQENVKKSLEESVKSF